MSELEEDVCDGQGGVALRSQSRLPNAAAAADIIVITIIIIKYSKEKTSVLLVDCAYGAHLEQRHQ